MEWLLGVDWHKMLVPNTPLLEIFLRGTLVYLALYALLRLVLKRQSSGLGVTDVLVVVLIADAAQNAMADDYTSVPDGVLLVAVIIGWSLALDWLGFHLPAVQRFISPAPLTLVRHGRLIRRNMRKELITEDELMTQLRLQGLTRLEQVEAAFMEGDGQISVIRRDQEHVPPP